VFKLRQIQVTEEEYIHLIQRRSALERYKAKLQTPLPDDEYGQEIKEKQLSRMEAELEKEWGLLV
jgi:hypothetical protein